MIELDQANRKAVDVQDRQNGARRFDLTGSPWIKKVLLSRWPQFILTSVALAGFVLAILTGLLGTPVGSRNFGIIFVWIAWWAILMLIAVPVFGRGWCSICPIPAPGEWLQRGTLLQPGQKKGLGFGFRWPKRVRNIWIQNGVFVMVALFSSVVLTQPRTTGIVLAAFLFIALGASLIFERRAFCRYLCPVGGFIGLYSQVAPVELRVKDPAVCAAHTVKSCYIGNEAGYGCPWMVFPGGLTKNTYCGTCMECLRTCTEDNILIQVRPIGSDLSVPNGRKLDEAYKAFIMLGSAIVYMAVLLGPWGFMKKAAYSVGSMGWLTYALTFLGFVLVLLPSLFYVAVLVGRRLAGLRITPKRQFISLSYALVPLGLCAWIAFSLSFVLTNLSYILPVVSDPFGWGWNLFGTAGVAWTPYLTSTIPFLQVLALLTGLVGSVMIARRIAGEGTTQRAGLLQSIPVNLFCLTITLVLLGLLIG
jgi:polyferredoxin